MSNTIGNIILIEDELQIRRFVTAALESENFQVYCAETGKQGLIEIGTRKPDAVILDLGLPDMDGLEVIKDTRNWSNVPIIILSARTQESEKVAALDAGADDFVSKPFGTPELLARLRAQLRRRAMLSDVNQLGVHVFGSIIVDLPKRLVSKNGQTIHLTPIEFRLFTELVKNAGRVVTQRQLLKEVWGPSYVDNEHYLRIYMSHLRQKLEDNPTQPEHLITEIGVGFRFI
ncbi:DNA-binding response regulator [Methylotenera oryzisoli]|uniref:DNA-binding response regulator n=1 Tax=Methylotenera oryzisoli TaxID=2080758 RepID=A0A4Y9VPS3_9PROT|nr:response regulator [Methylotenera oryzisoli]TFW70652.1 DNA-binding response regulator [Methylotenera oryzisoli]